MFKLKVVSAFSIATWLVLAAAGPAYAQAQPPESRWSVDLAAGLDFGVNGNVNSGAIGRLNGLATAILPNTYGDVYGSGIQFRVGAGYALDELSEVRGVFIMQSADADLVRLGDIGPSSLYAQYSDYQTLSLDVGYRRYFPVAQQRSLRWYGEATIGLGFIDAIDVELAAPQANVTFQNTDFYDQTAAFTWTLAAGMLYTLNPRLDLNAQIGIRHVSGLSEVDQFEGTGLEDINNDSGRLTIPFIVGVRVKF